MAKPIFPENMLKQASGMEMTLESIAGKLTYFHEQLQSIHWQTASYAEHVATGSLYEYVFGFKDGLMEKLMGYTGRRPAPHRMENLSNISSMSVVMDMMSFADSLKRYGEANGYHDVCNLADEFSGEAAKAKYLLTLS